jgi:hypothetical protein
MLAIKPIRNFALASTLTLAALTSCVPNKSVFKETSSPYLSEKSIEILDSFSKENQKVLSDTNYVKCGADTILVQPYLETQFDRFQKTIEQSIQKSVPKSIVDTVESKTFYPTMRQYIKQPKYIYADEYKDIVPVIDNSKFYTKSNFDVYVPVEYYGIPTNNK